MSSEIKDSDYLRLLSANLIYLWKVLVIIT